MVTGQLRLHPDNSLLTIFVSTDNHLPMARTLATQLKQNRAFSSREEEALIGLRMAAARVIAPWAQFLKTTADLSTSQYNVLRILRGTSEGLNVWRNRRAHYCPRPGYHPTRGPTRQARPGQAHQKPDGPAGGPSRNHPEGTRPLDELYPHVQRMPRALLGHLSQTQLQQLSGLLSEALDGMGTFP